jgi:hypothetical protein
MRDDKVFLNPCDEVIFKSPFYDLMEEIRGEELMDISIWEVVGERL